MTENIKKTPLNSEHRKHGGRLVPFAGFEMPVQYAGVIEEHMAVRTAAGIFDVSHMGEIEVKGPDALPYLQKISSNNVAKLADGQIHYTALTYTNGTFVDDMLIYKYDENHYLLVVNASNTDKDFAWCQKNTDGFDVKVTNLSDKYAQIAIQGPKAQAILTPLTDVDLDAIKYYWFTEGKVEGAECIVSRTGYTGEDGFEVYCKPEDAVKIWQAMMKEGEKYGLQPAGLGARDTLRLEAKMALYGNDIDDTTTVLEADLGWICKLKKGDFNGRDVLLKQKEEGLKRMLVGFEMVDKGIARHGYPVVDNGKEIGYISSGSFAPYLKRNIGLAYLPIELTEIGTEFKVGIRGKELKAKVVETPFYKREK
ncbi:MAG: glycine cleavage system aminomethyltransferase GcvT [Acidobacteria bacterium]|nr:glycine cleavage system aminomethyltransferase GcvT [Acidobacteriota bacterium]